MATETPTQPPRVVIRRDRPEGREFAPRRFEGQRNQNLDASEADIAESATGPAVSADRPEGAGLVVESSTVLGGGTSTRSTRPPARTAPRPRQAQWVGAASEGGGLRDQVLATAPSDVLTDPEALAPEEQTVRPPRAGPAPVTGEPCVCAWEWATDPDSGETVVSPGKGIGTSFKGVPKFYRDICIVCGGNISGTFDYSLVEKFAPQEWQAIAPVADANAILAQVMEQVAIQREQAPRIDSEALASQVTDRVMESVASYMASDQFAAIIATKITASAVAKKPSNRRANRQV